MIRFQAMVGTWASPVHLHAKLHRFSPRRRRTIAAKLAEIAVMAERWSRPMARAARAATIKLAEPPSWHGSRASPDSDAIQVRSGMGVRTWMPAADGHDERLGTAKRDADAHHPYQAQSDDTRATAEMWAHSAPSTWAQTAIMPRNKVIEVSAAASSTTARNMASSLNEGGT